MAGLPRGFTRNQATLDLIGGYVGHSKLVFMNGRGNATIVNEELGHWNGDRWYSNSSYRSVPVERTKVQEVVLGRREDRVEGFQPTVPAYWSSMPGYGRHFANGGGN